MHPSSLVETEILWFTGSEVYPIDDASRYLIPTLAPVSDVGRKFQEGFRREESGEPNIAFHSPKTIEHDGMQMGQRGPSCFVTERKPQYSGYHRRFMSVSGPL
jgi:hypothetical protein